MFVFIDLRESQLEDGRFSIYDTKHSRFLEINKKQVFDSFEDLEEHFRIFYENIYIQLKHLINSNLKF